MNFLSFAQNFEDVLLWRALGDIERGTYIDIGAQDPVHDSVSMAFYERGWRGIHVEPTPHYAAQLRAARPDERVIEAAVTDADGPIQFFEIVDTGLSTGVATIAEKHSEAGYPSSKLTVPCVRLDRLLDLEPEFHWMKIDVEGMEEDVLRSWGESKARPWILVIESTYPMTQTPSQASWLGEVTKRGYREVHFDGLSRFFVHQSQSNRGSAFAVPPNVFDDFVVAHGQFCARAIRTELEEARDQARDQEAANSELRTKLADTDHRLGEERIERARLLGRVALAEEQETAARAQAAEAANDVARLADQNNALAQEIARAAAEANSQFQRMAAERTEAEQALRREAQRLEAELRGALDEARKDQAETSAELARFIERAAQLEERSTGLQDQCDRLAAELAGTRSALDRSEALLSSARGLIARARAARPGRWQRLGEFLGLARMPVAWSALLQWAELHQDRGPEPASPIAGPCEEIDRMTSSNPYLRADSLAELLSWDDVDFVRCAYVTVLGRQPDAGGEAYYADRVRRGHSKLEILWQLRRSPEARQHDPGIAGFDRALKRAAYCRSRWIGWLASPVLGADDDSTAARRHRSLLNELASIRARQDWHGRVLQTIVQSLQSAPAPAAAPAAAPAPLPSDGSQQGASAAGETAEGDAASDDLDSRARHALKLISLEFSPKCA